MYRTVLSAPRSSYPYSRLLYKIGNYFLDMQYIPFDAFNFITANVLRCCQLTLSPLQFCDPKSNILTPSPSTRSITLICTLCCLGHSYGTVCPRSSDPFYKVSYLLYKMGNCFLGRQYVPRKMWIILRPYS